MKLRESLNTRNIALAAAIAMGTTGLFAAGCGSAPESDSAPVTTSPYEGTDVLVYAPSPLTAGEAIEYFVDRDQVRATDDDQEAWTAELTDEFVDQTGLDPNAQFPGNPDGTAFIRIED